MRNRIVYLLLLFGCGAVVTGAALRATQQDIPSANTPAKVSITLQAGKLKRGKTYTAQVRVDLTGVTAPGTTQSAAIGSYVIPVSFDRSALEFVSASGGETSAFASGPVSVTNAQTANASGVVTLVGGQTASDVVTGPVGVASVRFRVIGSGGGRTSVAVNPELAAPGLSLGSTARSTTTGDPYRIPAMGQSSSFKIK